MPELTAMDYVRGALANAAAEGMSVIDLIAMAEHAQTAQAFDLAVNELAQTVKDESCK